MSKIIPWKTTQEYDALHDEIPGYLQFDGSVSTQKCPYHKCYQDCAVSDPRTKDCPRFGGWKSVNLNIVQCRGKRYFDAVKEPEPTTIGTTWRE
jgi:hypothetical protein